MTASGTILISAVSDGQQTVLTLHLHNVMPLHRNKDSVNCLSYIRYEVQEAV